VRITLLAIDIAEYLGHSRLGQLGFAYRKGEAVARKGEELVQHSGAVLACASGEHSSDVRLRSLAAGGNP